MINPLRILVPGVLYTLCFVQLNANVKLAYNALVLTKHTDNSWQLLFRENPNQKTVFLGITGKSSEGELVAKAKKNIIKKMPGYQPTDLHLVFKKIDTKNSRATLIFYSPLFVHGAVSKSSWMKVKEIEKKNKIYYGPRANKKRSKTGTMSDGLYTYITNPTFKVLATAISNAEKGTYLDDDSTSQPLNPLKSSTQSNLGPLSIPQGLAAWPKKGDVILFYKAGIKPKTQKYDYFEFTNTAIHPMVVPDKSGINSSTNKPVVWPATEYYFQAQKFTDPIAVFLNELESKEVGTLQKAIPTLTHLQQKDPTAWKAGGNVTTMLNALRAKFSQNGECQKSSKTADQNLRNLLLDTGNAVLVEDSGQGSHNDKIWGAGDTYTGFNYLGQLLMHVRHELRTGKAYLFTKADGPQQYKGVSITPEANAPQWYLDRLAQLTPQLSPTPNRSLAELTDALKALLP